MKARHPQADVMFGTKTQKKLKAKAKEFLRLHGVNARVDFNGSVGISIETGVDPEVFEWGL